MSKPPPPTAAKRPAQTGPVPPTTLSRPAADLWRQIALDYAITDSGGLSLLSSACASWDRAEQAAKVVAKDGLITLTKDGRPVPHPCIGIERDSRAAYVRTLRALNLDVVPTSPDRGRPPTLPQFGKR